MGNDFTILEKKNLCPRHKDTKKKMFKRRNPKTGRQNCRIDVEEIRWAYEEALCKLHVTKMSGDQAYDSHVVMLSTDLMVPLELWNSCSFSCA